MNEVIQENLTSIIQIIVVLYVSYRNLGNLRRRGTWVPAVLFMFFLVITLATGFYWVTHALMTGEHLYGFSAMDIGEIGLFLLLMAILGASFEEPLSRDLPALAAALLFAAGNAVLWGAWRGAWIRDIVAGFFLCILIYTLIRGLKKTNSLSRRAWIAFGTGSAAIFLTQAAAVMSKGIAVKIWDLSSAVFWFAGIAYFLVRIIRILRERRQDEGLISLACAAEGWIVCALYLNVDPYYTIVDLINAFMIILMMQVLEREWGEAL